jgi:hypothetical protein
VQGNSTGNICFENKPGYDIRVFTSIYYIDVKQGTWLRFFGNIPNIKM